MASARDLRLQVLLQAVDKVTAPMRSISSRSAEAAKALKVTRDQLKDLNAQQTAVQRFRELQGALKASQEQARAVRGRIEELRTAQTADAAAAKAQARELAAAEKVLRGLTRTTEAQTAQLKPMREELQRLGIRNIAADEQRLQSAIQSTTDTIYRQRTALDALAATQKRLAATRATYARSQRLASTLAGAGVATGAAGAAMGAPVAASVRSFAELEAASTQLRVAMMGADGRVGDEFERINALAIKLGDRLPGTTAEFLDMMTMLRRQGVTGKAILGGVGEAAAYLGIQLRMPMAEAAEFAAKIQDATRTPEGDMLGLLDQIQRANSLGVDRNNMLQAVTKMGPALSIVRKEGLAAMQELMPLAVMMDQTGMAGEAAGNAIRKVLQFSVDADKRDKANKALKEVKAGFTLDLSDGKGEFGGMDKLFEQLGRLQALNTAQRLNVIKALFGDDSETLQVVNTLMSKGVAGYREVAEKMQQQADLRMRVNEQLGTLTNLWESAQGSFTNVLAQVGATLAPELKQLVTWLNETTTSVSAWVRENPALVAAIAKSAAVVSMLLLVMGSLTMALAALVGPFAVIRYGFALFGLQAAGVLQLGAALRFLSVAFMSLTPWGRVISLLVAGAGMIYTDWGAVVAWLAALPGRMFSIGVDMAKLLVGGLASMWGLVRDGVTSLADSAVGWFKEKLGIRSPSRVFALAGGELSAGAAQGILQRQDLVRRAALAMAATATSALPLATSAAQAQLPNFAAVQARQVQMPTVDVSGGPRIDRRPPLAAAASAPAPAPVYTGDTHFHIHPAPGMDERALARLVAQEVARLKRQEEARGRSSLHDVG